MKLANTLVSQYGTPMRSFKCFNTQTSRGRNSEKAQICTNTANKNVYVLFILEPFWESILGLFSGTKKDEDLNN